MKAICSSETSVETQQTTRRHIPEDDTLYLNKVYQSRLLRTSSLVWSTSLLPERTIALLVQCVQAVKVDIPDVSLVRNVIHISFVG
jgi:hypothetical protein